MEVPVGSAITSSMQLTAKTRNIFYQSIGLAKGISMHIITHNTFADHLLLHHACFPAFCCCRVFWRYSFSSSALKSVKMISSRVIPLPRLHHILLYHEINVFFF